MRITTRRAAWAALLALGPILTSVGGAEPPASPATGQTPPTGPGLVYTPPLRGAPVTRVGGASRGDQRGLTLSVLAPEHTGLTSAAQPTLYWFVSGPVTQPIEFTLVDPRSPRPLVEATLPAPTGSGVQALPLTRQLQIGVEYQWFISVVADPDQRARDIIAGGGVRRVTPDSALTARLGQTPRREWPALYAAAGLWYDALAALAAAIEAAPGDRQLRRQRADLLEQVGLTAAAAYERQAAAR